MEKAYINAVNQRLLFEPEECETDIAIVLGARSVSGELARAAMKGLAAGQFKKVILCGGHRVFEPWVYAALKIKGIDNVTARDFFSWNREADYMRTVMAEEGDQVIFSENLSKHTGQNFENIRDFVTSQKFKSASIVTVAYHQRRAVETCKRWIPDLDAVPVPVYPYGLSRDQWLEKWAHTPIIKNVVAGEFQKLSLQNSKNYYAQGHCTPVEIRMKQGRSYGI